MTSYILGSLIFLAACSNQALPDLQEQKPNQKYLEEGPPSIETPPSEEVPTEEAVPDEPSDTTNEPEDSVYAQLPSDVTLNPNQVFSDVRENLERVYVKVVYVTHQLQGSSAPEFGGKQGNASIIDEFFMEKGQTKQITPNPDLLSKHDRKIEKMIAKNRYSADEISHLELRVTARFYTYNKSKNANSNNKDHFKKQVGTLTLSHN